MKLQDTIEQLFAGQPADHKCFLNLTFKDGSNPYSYRGTKADMTKELAKWEKNFNIELIKLDGNGIFCEASES